jgi:hypothetical protein
LERDKIQMFEYIQTIWVLALQGDRQGIWFGAAVYAFLICEYAVLFKLLIRSWLSTTGQLSHRGKYSCHFKITDSVVI